MDISAILLPLGTFKWPLGLFCSHFGIFSPFWYVVPRKIWQPWTECRRHASLFCPRDSADQGCQIYLSTTYQNGKNISNDYKTFKCPQNIPNIYQMATKYTKWPQNIPNGGKIDQTNIKCTNIFHRKNLQSLPKLGFSGLKIDHLATPPRTCIYFRFVSIMQVIVQKRPDTPFNQSQPKHSNGWFRATN
jgi:hypothetical protein